MTQTIQTGTPRVVLVAAAALVDTEGRVLLTERPAGKPLAGTWEFPGGKVETGETPERALVRELREELAIDVSAADLEPLTFASYSYATMHVLMPLYRCRAWRGTPSPAEGQALRWVRPEDMRRQEMPPADIPLIDFLVRWSGRACEGNQLGGEA